MGVSSSSHFLASEPDRCVIKTVVELKCYIKVQEEGIRMQQKLVLKETGSSLGLILPAPPWR